MDILLVFVHRLPRFSKSQHALRIPMDRRMQRTALYDTPVVLHTLLMAYLS